jgi:hypothetical protein
MGTLMKDVPATRYSLLDRDTPEQRHAQLIRNFEEDVLSSTQRSFDPFSPPAVTYRYRSTAEELEAYMRHAYRR